MNMDQLDFEKARNIYIEKLKKENKPFCVLCLDKNERILKLIDNNWICEDCIYTRNLLYEIKKI